MNTLSKNNKFKKFFALIRRPKNPVAGSKAFDLNYALSKMRSDFRNQKQQPMIE
jgi:hypothetical protein